MITITKRQAVRRCKWFWKHALKTGKYKGAILNSLGEKERKEFCRYTYRCPLCEYVETFGYAELIEGEPSEDCKKHCPIVLQFGHSCVQVISFEDESQQFAKMIMKLKE